MKEDDNNRHTEADKPNKDIIDIDRTVKKNKNGNANWWEPAVAIFARMSGWIVAPVLIATFIGRWLDRKYSTAPWMLLGTVGVAFVISMIGLILEATKEYKKIAGNGKKNEETKDKK